MTSDELIEQLGWRYAVKRFNPDKKINDSDWFALEQALVLTPSSFGLQPWRFLVVQNAELRKKLRAASWGQSQVEDCSHYIVFCANDKVDETWVEKYLDRMVEIRGVSIDSLSRLRESIVADVVHGARSTVAKEWAARQIYIALGNLMTSAAVLNIDTCPMEGLEPQEYDKILDLVGSGFSTVCACALGYRSDTDKFANMKKVRFSVKDVVQYL